MAVNNLRFIVSGVVPAERDTLVCILIFLKGQKGAFSTFWDPLF